MTMQEKIKIHVQIERENTENLEAWRYWNSLSVDEIANMINEKDMAMDWDEQFSFLCDLLDAKMAVA